MYEGAPSVHLTPVAKIMREKLSENWRCMYLNTAPMVAGMRTCLAINGVDVERETTRGSLVLRSEREHLVDGLFDIDRMLAGLKDALDEALGDGFVGLFAIGDMTWEFGPGGDFAKLLDYEWRVEDFLRAHPKFSAICQYHASTLPAEVLQDGMAAHPGIFVNETLSLMNPQFVHPRYSNGANGIAPEGPKA
jgi:hypothetical protein